MAGPAKKSGTLKRKANNEVVGAVPKKAKALETSPPLSPHATPPTPAMRALSLQPGERSTPAYTAPVAVMFSSPSATPSIDPAATPATTAVAIAAVAHSVPHDVHPATISVQRPSAQLFPHSITINGGNFIVMEDNEGEAMSMCLDFEPLGSRYRSDTFEIESGDAMEVDEEED
ncbi:hypothetical protein EAF04_010979 [Stromatinia cepivora]|nr:hypothetical protein EAF04_010979 [Stromatinia cepivora]